MASKNIQTVFLKPQNRPLFTDPSLLIYEKILMMVMMMHLHFAQQCYLSEINPKYTV
jgi:hypothetical protein